MTIKSKASKFVALVVVVGLSAGCESEVSDVVEGLQGGSGESGRIAYGAFSGYESTDGYRAGDIYSNDPRGGGEQRITDDGMSATPSYSPDGSKMVFTKSSDIYIADADGSGEMRLTEEEFNSGPVISPDGEYIAFARGGGTESEIYTMRVDGSDVQQLTDGPGELEAKESPAWNPRELEVAFTATVDASSNDDDTIYTVDFPGGGNLTQITEANDLSNEYSPAYSPDGQTIAYAATADVNNYDHDIYTVAADGSDTGNPTQLTESYDNIDPVFSPNGERIAFSSNRGGNGYDIVTMDSESGDDKFNVTEDSDRGGSSPSWSDPEPSVGNSEDPDTGWDLVSSDNGEPTSEKHRTGKGEW